MPWQNMCSAPWACCDAAARAWTPCCAATDGRRAALDVFASQPLGAGHPLFGLDNVLLTPHAAGLTVDSMRRMGSGTVVEVGRILAGLHPLNCVNRAGLDSAVGPA